MSDKKKRSTKTIARQYEILVEELQNNVAFRTNKNSPESPNAIKDTWAELTEKLNSIGGPVRSTDSWKRIFIDWKSHVKRKARMLKNSQIRTGGGPPSEKSLTAIELRLIENIGSVVVDGMNIPERAIDNNEIEVALRAEEDITMTDSTHDISTPPCTTTSTTADVIEEHIVNQRKRNPLKRGLDAVVEAVTAQTENSQQTLEGILSELRGIKTEMKRNNKIKKFRAKIEYEKARAKYPNFNLECLSDSE